MSHLVVCVDDGRDDDYYQCDDGCEDASHHHFFEVIPSRWAERFIHFSMPFFMACVLDHRPHLSIPTC